MGCKDVFTDSKQALLHAAPSRLRLHPWLLGKMCWAIPSPARDCCGECHRAPYRGAAAQDHRGVGGGRHALVDPPCGTISSCEKRCCAAAKLSAGDRERTVVQQKNAFSTLAMNRHDRQVNDVDCDTTIRVHHCCDRQVLVKIVLVRCVDRFTRVTRCLIVSEADACALRPRGSVGICTPVLGALLGQRV